MLLPGPVNKRQPETKHRVEALSMFDDLNRVGVELVVGGEDRATGAASQRDDHPVEGIFVVRRQRFCSGANLRGERQDAKVVPLGYFGHEFRRFGNGAGQSDFTEPQLPREFPHRDAEDHGVGCRGKFFPRH